MIRATVVERSGEIVRFVVTGHAGFAKSGSDIVCAAVSVLVLNAINSCEALLRVNLPAVDDGETISCEVPQELNVPEVQLLLRSMAFGLEQTAKHYSKFVKLNKVYEE